MNLRYPFVSRRAIHRCEYCHAPEVIANFPFEVEHIVPQAQDGSNETDNLALSCRSCNLYKSDALTALDPATNESVRLFHPRQDDWDSFFIIELETGRIEGRNSVGRATVARFQMNTAFQTEARILWARLGIFP